jgi:hypothetical protein
MAKKIYKIGKPESKIRTIAGKKRQVWVKKVAKGKYLVRLKNPKTKGINYGAGYKLDRAHPYANMNEPWEKRGRQRR